jgi:hypothetical protein
MVADVTSTFTANNTVTPTKAVGSTIDAASFRTMVNTLDALIQHNHTFTDDYTSNCQCNCQRGSI